LPNYGTSIHSKIIDNGDVNVYTRYGIEREHFATEIERKTYDYVRTYAEQNRGQAPSYATVVAEIDGFDYVPSVTDSFEFLVGRLKDAAGKRMYAELFNGGELSKKFTEMTSEEFGNFLLKSVERITIDSNTRTNVPNYANIKTAHERFLEEFRARKEGTSFRIWRSKFHLINEQIGGYLSSNVYTWYARSGRGKSVVTMEEGIEAAFQGANVLVWALEMSEFEWWARAYSSISARLGTFTANIEGVDYSAGFENKSLLMGRLTEEYEQSLEQFTRSLNEVIPGNISLRAADHTEFTDRSIRQLETDIIETKADVVVIDPIYYMDFEANTSKTAGGDVAATSKKLRHLAGRTKTVIHVITQADENSNEKDDEGNRELKPPKRAEIKKTKAVLEDAACVFGIDTLAHEGRGIIEIGKGRNGGEDTRVELLYLPNYGIVRELSDKKESSKFTFLN